MSDILIHAGMPKTGSSSIQKYLSLSKKALATENISLLVVRNHKTDLCSINPFERGRVNSGSFVHNYQKSDNAGKILLARLLTQQLDKYAGDCKKVVVTSEGFTRLIFSSDDIFLSSLVKLSKKHRVTILYYIRPQHTLLEAGWKQWGFRSGKKPSEYLRKKAKHLHYLTALKSLEQYGRDINIVIRPFRRDLLQGNDVVFDFCTYLGIKPTHEELINAESNIGLPLEIANLLSSIPQGILWKDMHDVINIDKLKKVIKTIDIPPSDKSQLSRNILKNWCFHIYEKDNLKLIQKLEWETDYFIAKENEINGKPKNLSALDALWKTAISDSEQLFLSHILQRTLRDVER